jgi:hypothetical protein
MQSYGQIALSVANDASPAAFSPAEAILDTAISESYRMN